MININILYTRVYSLNGVFIKQIFAIELWKSCVYILDVDVIDRALI